MCSFSIKNVSTQCERDYIYSKFTDMLNCP